MTALNVTRIWIELAVWAAMVSTAQFSLSGSRLMPSPGSRADSISKIAGPLFPLLTGFTTFVTVRREAFYPG